MSRPCGRGQKVEIHRVSAESTALQPVSLRVTTALAPNLRYETVRLSGFRPSMLLRSRAMQRRRHAIALSLLLHGLLLFGHCDSDWPPARF